MVHRIARAFHFTEGVVIAPVDASATPRASGELLEQKFMDRIIAKRHFLRFVFVALGAILCLKVSLAEASALPPCEVRPDSGSGRHGSGLAACYHGAGKVSAFRSPHLFSAIEVRLSPHQ